MRIDGTIMTVDEEIKLDPKKAHTVEIVVDRIMVRDLESKDGVVNPNRSRLADSVELCLKKGEGSMVLLDADTNEETRFSQSFVCPEHPNADIPDIEPRSFSFNSPHGACSTCHGLGSILQVEESSVIPNPKLSLAEGAIHPWATSASRMGFMTHVLYALAEKAGFNMNTPWNKLTDDNRKIILWGYDKPLSVKMETATFGGNYQTTFEGAIPNLQRRHHETDSSYIRQQIEEYMLELPCPECHGQRLKKEILGVTVGDKNIVQATEMSTNEAAEFFKGLLPSERTQKTQKTEKTQKNGNSSASSASSPSSLSSYEYTVVKEGLLEIIAGLSFPGNVGLTFLTLSPPAATLSGGEAQRIRLATQ